MEEKLTQLEQWFQTDTSWDLDWRDNAREWYDLYHGNQWTTDEIAALEERGQAVLTFNHIKPAIDSIIGAERQNRPKISMAGRTADDEKIAQVKTSLYDYIQYESRTDDELDKVIENSFVTGRGWIHIYPEMDGDKFVDIKHSWVDYRDIFIDPLSRRDDMSDCRRLHHAVFTDEDIVKKSFKNYKSGDDYTAPFVTSSEDEMWYEKNNRKRPRIISTWYLDENSKLNIAIWTKGQLLYFKKDPYGIDKFPYVQYTANRDLNNFPYGIVKGMKSAQEEVNKRHSKAMHYLNAAQVWAEESAFVNMEDAKKTLAKPDGITILADGALAEGRIQRLDNAALAATHIQLMDFAKNEILGVAGINAAFLGQASQYESAKKANMSISQSQTVLVPLLNKLRIARHDLAYITMKLVPKFYVQEKLVRILQPNGQYAFMPLNQMVLLDDDTIVRYNDTSNDDVDIIIEDAPRGLNEREEQFMLLMQLQGQTQKPIPMEILLKYSSIKDKYQMAEDLKGYYQIEQQLQQAQGYIQQLQQQIQQLGGQIAQKDSIIVQTQTARAVEKEVNKAKVKNAQETGLGILGL